MFSLQYAVFYCDLYRVWTHGCVAHRLRFARQSMGPSAGLGVRDRLRHGYWSVHWGVPLSPEPIRFLEPLYGRLHGHFEAVALGSGEGCAALTTQVAERRLDKPNKDKGDVGERR